MYRIQAPNLDAYNKIFATIVQDSPIAYHFKNDKRLVINVQNLSQELKDKLYNLGAIITPETQYYTEKHP